MDLHPWPAKMAKSSIRIYHSRVVLPAQLDLPPCVKDIIDVFTNQVVLGNTSKERKKKEGCHKFNDVCIFCVFYKAFHKQKHPFLFFR